MSLSGPVGTLVALRWPLTSVKTETFGPKVLQIVHFLTGRVLLNLYGRILFMAKKHYFFERFQTAASS
jgi:hypothetical protein